LKASLQLSFGTKLAEAMQVSVSLPYLNRDDLYLKEKPYVTDFAVDHIPGAEASNHRFDYQSLIITDVQTCRERFTLEKNGFCFLRGKTSVTLTTADDEEYIREVYFPELEQILHEALPGYERIDYLDHLVQLPLSGSSLPC
jgi:hypothetical protein